MSGRLYVFGAPTSDGGAIVGCGIEGFNGFLKSTEILDGSASAWSAGPDITFDGVVGGSGVMFLQLESGSILAAGGYGMILSAYGASSFSGVLDPSTNTWTETAPLDTPRGTGQAVELPDHRVMLIGGIGETNNSTNTVSITAGPLH
jgi:hypothetical protein